MNSIILERMLKVSFSCRQYQDFLEDLEEDEAIRKNVNIYRGWCFGCVVDSIFEDIWYLLFVSDLFVL